MKFTEKLDLLMKENNLNRRTFAMKCDIPYTTVCGWYDKGYDGVRMNNVRKIASTFNTGLEYWAYDELPEQAEKAPAPEGTEAVSMEQSNRLYDALVAAGLIVDDDLAAQDFQFLGHICDLITDWFSGKHPE